jgi:hypothetical protein
MNQSIHPFLLNLSLLLSLGACQATSNDRQPTALTNRDPSIEVIQTKPETDRNAMESGASQPNSSEAQVSTSHETDVQLGKEKVQVTATETNTPSPTNSSTVESGTGVNNGMGPTGSAPHCEGKTVEGKAMTFNIQYTAIITYIQGTLSQGEDYISFGCETVNESGSTSELNKELWSCKEIRRDAYDTDQLYQVKLHKQGSSDAIVGEVTIEQSHPLPPKLFGTLQCLVKKPKN